MTAGARIPLAGPDARILRLLAHVVAIGRNERSFTAADVFRVAEAHLDHPHTLRRALAAERERLADAERRIVDLQERVSAVIANRRAVSAESADAVAAGARVVELTPRQAQVMTGLCTGLRHKELASRLGKSPSGVTNLAFRAARRMGVADSRRAVELLRAGRVLIRVEGVDAA